MIDSPILLTNEKNFIFYFNKLVFNSLAMAADEKDQPMAKYAYSFPQTGTDSGEWAFKVTECSRISNGEYKKLKKNCKPEK